MIAYGYIGTGSAGRINKDSQAVVTTVASLEAPSAHPILNIHVSCKNLPKLDVTSQSDPMAVMYYMNEAGAWIECARTEVIWNDPNPTFVQVFQAMYVFETDQPLKFAVYDVDSEKAALGDHDLIGWIETNVYNLAANTDRELKFDLKHSGHPDRKCGEISLVPAQAEASRSVVSGTMKARKMKKMRTFSKNNPFFLLSKPSEAGKYLPVYRSETIRRCYECTWRPFSLPMHTLCNGDMDTPLEITLMDNHENHPDVAFGRANASLRTLMEGAGQEITAKTMDGKKVAGILKFSNMTVAAKPTFVDYLRSGLQLNLITAIDFTSSNGRVTDPKSLHFNCPGRMNQYEMCINEVGRIICQYDRDQMFPVYGFGGRINGVLDHCFPLTFNAQNPCVSGLEGILGVYRQSLNHVELYGPTLFTPIIRNATQAALASYAPPSYVYTVLMILTDGAINDMQETINAIVEASSAPLSIIIVGVGNANFQQMDALDGDGGLLWGSSGRAVRDIVQFVPFNKYASNPQKLACEVLAEIPHQVDAWCKANGFIPQLPQ